MKGVVTKYFPEKGFGFIKLEDGSSCYFHKSKIEGEVEHIYSGDVAEVECRESAKKPDSFEAVSVEIKPKELHPKFVRDISSEENFAEGKVTTVNPEKGFGFVSTDRYHDVYFSFNTISGDTIPGRDHLVLLTVRPSRRKQGTYEASSLTPFHSISFSNLVSETSQEMSERSFQLCMLLLQSQNNFVKKTITSDDLCSFSSKLSSQQKRTALQFWLDSKVSYYDEEYLRMSFDYLGAYDKLQAISRSQSISFELAFKQLNEDVKSQLFYDSLEVCRTLDHKMILDRSSEQLLNLSEVKKQKYIDCNYLRSKFAELTFFDVFTILLTEDLKVRIEVVVEFLEQYPQNEFTDDELEVAVNLMYSGYDLERERVKAIFESIHRCLSFSQKQKILDYFVHSKIKLYDDPFLLSEINRYSLSERIVLGEKVDQSTRSSIYESIILLIQDGLPQPLAELIDLINKFKFHNHHDLSARLISTISDKISPEEKYELWKKGLIDDIDQDWLISNLNFKNTSELSKALTLLDPSQADRIIDATLKSYSEINQQSIYDEVASALRELKEVHIRYRYPYEILDKYMNKLYERSSQEFKYRWFLDRLINKVQLSMIEEDLKTFDSYNFTCFLEALSPQERIEFSKIVLSLHVLDTVGITYDQVIHVIGIFSKYTKLQFEFVNQILLIVHDDIKYQLMQNPVSRALSDDMFRSRLEFLFEYAESFSPGFNSYLVFSALSRSSTQEITFKFLRKCTDLKGLLITTRILLKEGLYYFKRGHYERASILDIWEEDSGYIKYVRRKSPLMFPEINNLACEGIKTVESISKNEYNFISSKMIPLLENMQYKCDHFLHELDEIVSIIKEIKEKTSHAFSSIYGLSLAIDKSLYNFITTYHTRIPDEVINTDSVALLRKYGKTFYKLKSHYSNSQNSVILSETCGSIELLETCTHEFLKGVQIQIERMIADRKTFSSCLDVIENLIDKNEDTIIHSKWLREVLYNSTYELINSELQEYESVSSYKKWLQLRGLINKLKSRIDWLFPNYICPYIESLENIRTRTIHDFIINGPIKGYTQPRYERSVALIQEINRSYDKSQAKELINLIHSYVDDEFQLKLWLYEFVAIFDFERYAMVYFTLTREERRTFNKRVREIIKIDLDKKLLAVRVPWKLVKKVANETVYEATWRSVWFQDGAIRFCMDEGIFSAPYNLSFARKDFNSIYSFLSGKRGGDLTVYCLNGSIVEVQGLDELKELIQRVIITSGLTESNNFLFKSEGENRVPVNLLLKNECMNVLSKLVGEGIKVHRVYEKIWKVDHGIPVPFNFDISYIFPVPVTDDTYVLLWESARLEKSKATYVFNCPHDQLDEYVKKLTMFIDKKVNVRSAILESNIVQGDLGFRGRIEHENFDIHPWKKRLVSYLPGYSEKIFESTEAEQK